MKHSVAANTSAVSTMPCQTPPPIERASQGVCMKRICGQQDQPTSFSRSRSQSPRRPEPARDTRHVFGPLSRVHSSQRRLFKPDHPQMKSQGQTSGVEPQTKHRTPYRPAHHNQDDSEIHGVSSETIEATDNQAGRWRPRRQCASARDVEIQNTPDQAGTPNSQENEATRHGQSSTRANNPDERDGIGDHSRQQHESQDCLADHGFPTFCPSLMIPDTACHLSNSLRSALRSRRQD